MSDMIDYNKLLITQPEEKEKIDISIDSATNPKKDGYYKDKLISMNIPILEDLRSKDEIIVGPIELTAKQAFKKTASFLLHAREFPLEPIIPEDVELKVIDENIPTILNSNSNQNGKFEEEPIIDKISPVTKTTTYKSEYTPGGGSRIIRTDVDLDPISGKDSNVIPELDIINTTQEFRVLNQDYEKEKTIGAAPVYNSFIPDTNNFAKQEEGEISSTEIPPAKDFKVLDQDYEKEKTAKSSSAYISFAPDSSDFAKLEEEEISLISLSPYVNKGKFSQIPYATGELTYQQALKKMQTKEQTTNLGELHVYPVNPGGEGGISEKYIIPFEFNPEITESGTGARFEAASLLSRVGDIQTYIKTESNSVSFSTNYQILSENTDAQNPKNGDNGGVGHWMKDFHLRNIQSIETAYRGLVYPQTSKKEGSYFRPPLVKIVFDSKSADGRSVSEIPFNSLLTYPYKIGNTTKIYHKSFIVSKVGIKKDWGNTSIILNDNLDGIIDLQGFEVSLELIEVDPMYIGILPSFEDYYSTAERF